MEKITAAIIGLGRIASLLEDDTLREKPCTHAGAIAANADCVLAAGCDNNEERRNLFAKKWQVPVYADAAEMIRTHKPQILVIATHPDSHFQYCFLAAQNKIPVVICEKPLADTIKEAKNIAALAASSVAASSVAASSVAASSVAASSGAASSGAKGSVSEKRTIIMTNHERRYSQDYIRAKSILEQGSLGSLLAVRACLYMGKNRQLVDQLWHDGTHLADAIMFLTNSVLKHRKHWGAKLTSRCGTAWLEGELLEASLQNRCKKHGEKPAQPIPVIIELGAGRDHLVFEIEFSCEKGRLRIGNGIFEVSQSVPSPYAENFNSLQNTGEVFSGPTGYFANMLGDAVSCVRDPSRKPVSGAEDGLRVIEYLHSVKAWHPEKRRV